MDFLFYDDSQEIVNKTIQKKHKTKTALTKNCRRNNSLLSWNWKPWLSKVEMWKQIYFLKEEDVAYDRCCVMSSLQLLQRRHTFNRKKVKTKNFVDVNFTKKDYGLNLDGIK